jgi:hypothetical protein
MFFVGSTYAVARAAGFSGSFLIYDARHSNRIEDSSLLPVLLLVQLLIILYSFNGTNIYI